MPLGYLGKIMLSERKIILRNSECRDLVGGDVELIKILLLVFVVLLVGL